MPPIFRIVGTRAEIAGVRVTGIHDVAAAAAVTAAASTAEPLPDAPFFTGNKFPPLDELTFPTDTNSGSTPRFLHLNPQGPQHPATTADIDHISPAAQELIDRSFPPTEFSLPAGVDGSTVLDVYCTQLRLPLRMPLATIIGNASAQAREILRRDHGGMTDDQLIADVLEPLSTIGFEAVAAAQLAIRSAPEKSFAGAKGYLEQIASLAQTLILVRHINPHQALQILKQLFDVERPSNTENPRETNFDRFYSLRQAMRKYLRNPDGAALETVMATAPALSELNLAAFSLIGLTERLQIRAEVDGNGNISPESASRIKQNLLQFLQQQIPLFVAKFRERPTESLWNEIRAIGAACDILLGSLPPSPTGFWERAALDGPLQRLALSLNSRRHFNQLVAAPK